MPTLDTTTIAAAAAAVSAFLGFLSLVFVGTATRTQSKIAEFNNCIEIVKTLGEAQRKVKDKLGGSDHVFEFRELLNILETLALLVNRRKTTKVAKEYTIQFLIQVLAWIEIDQSMKNLIETSVTGIDTFKDLAIIRKRYRNEIDQLAARYQKS